MLLVPAQRGVHDPAALERPPPRPVCIAGSTLLPDTPIEPHCLTRDDT